MTDPLVQLESEVGIVALHPAPPPRTILVGSSTDTQFNAIRSFVTPIACWRVEDLLFDFDSSFVKPVGQRDLRELKRLRERLKQTDGGAELRPPLSIFGHADPVGNDDYNKQLSGRRAMAIYGLLVRDTNLWEKLFSQPMGRDDWGNAAVHTMVRALGFDPGPVSVNVTEALKAAIRLFQESNGIKPDGAAGPKTRRVLFLAYMDFLCGKDFALDKEEDFLGKGKDKDGKGDYQGCGEFNPVLLFSKSEKSELDQPKNHDARNDENEPNRRVLVFLFAPGTRVDPARWPCPRAKDGIGGCTKRLFADANVRRSPGDVRRERPIDLDTFACRFYDQMARRSPCENISPVLRIRLYDDTGKFIPDAPFNIVVSNETAPRVGRADRSGVVRARRIGSASSCVVQWGKPPVAGTPVSLPFQHTIQLQFATGDEQTQAERRLNNLGYVGDAEFEKKLILFKQDHPERFASNEMDGTLDAKAQQVIRDIHDSLPDDTRPADKE
jgi:putative peptidoglycan binding protein